MCPSLSIFTDEIRWNYNLICKSLSYRGFTKKIILASKARFETLTIIYLVFQTFGIGQSKAGLFSIYFHLGLHSYLSTCMSGISSFTVLFFSMQTLIAECKGDMSTNAEFLFIFISKIRLLERTAIFMYANSFEERMMNTNVIYYYQSAKQTILFLLLVNFCFVIFHNG